MSLLEFGQRAYDHHGTSFNGAAVTLIGFVAGDVDGGFELARYQISCCAADAAPTSWSACSVRQAIRRRATNG